MGSLQLSLVVFVLLSCVLPVRSGMNMYIRRMFQTCWLSRGVCKNECTGEEFFHILCGTQSLCCILKKDMPTLFVK
ncbi:beta-defensin 135 [Acomys russatus]|uniref:beta-defensin 135 n=1 Tax=Acomys russatus TaxID=60746 RepID=UPI0021E2FB6A|nr:beta-defensin 135 [Acomys russatus]